MSKHNSKPSLAVDIAPYPIDWADDERFYFLAGIIKAASHQVGVKVRWGGDWDSDDDFHDQTFMDLGHFEIRGDT
jgi:peptidoglycan L-alanyl-D-glutamate endopeptidase CwlK